MLLQLETRFIKGVEVPIQYDNLTLLHDQYEYSHVAILCRYDKQEKCQESHPYSLNLKSRELPLRLLTSLFHQKLSSERWNHPKFDRSYKFGLLKLQSRECLFWTLLDGAEMMLVETKAD